jgi:urease accessory protein
MTTATTITTMTERPGTPHPNPPPQGGRGLEPAPSSLEGEGRGGGCASAHASLYRLLAWTSPAYPTGAYSYSHGIEFAVEEGLVRDRVGLVAWIGHILRHGAGWVDAVLFARAYEADDQTLREIAELAIAWRGTAETALESTQQGTAFLTVTRNAWPQAALALLDDGPVALPIAFAVAARSVPRDAALIAFLHGISANLVSAGVRLVPLGQTDGQRAIAELAPVVTEVAVRAAACPLDRLGSAAPMVDWTSMRHEIQYTRLFRS